MLPTFCTLLDLERLASVQVIFVYCRFAMPDIQTRADIDRLLTAFYSQALTDPVIGHFFTEVVQLHLPTHLPRLGDFWASILLGSATYKGNPMVQHLHLNALSPMEAVHFDRWLSLWEGTVRTHFEGAVAEAAIQRAQQIGGLMQHKIQRNGGLDL